MDYSAFFFFVLFHFDCLLLISLLYSPSFSRPLDPPSPLPLTFLSLPFSLDSLLFFCS